MSDIDWRDIRDKTLEKKAVLTQPEFAAMMTQRHQMRRDMNTGGTTTLQDIYDFVAAYGDPE